MIARVAVDECRWMKAAAHPPIRALLIDGTAPAIPYGEKDRPAYQLKGLSLDRDAGIGFASNAAGHM